MFYNGLDSHANSRLNGVAGEALMNRIYEESYDLIENMQRIPTNGQMKYSLMAREHQCKSCPGG